MKYILLLISNLLVSIVTQAQGEFITQWQLSTGQTSINFSADCAATGVDYVWETIPAGITGNGTLAPGNGFATISGLPDGALIRLKLAPQNLKHFKMTVNADVFSLVELESWGTPVWTDLTNVFNGCQILQITATDIPDLSACTSLFGAFYNCQSITTIPNIENWNVSNISNFGGAFFETPNFNQNIGGWSTSNATIMESMFRNCASFNQNISSWNTSNVTDMSNMFAGAASFDQNIGMWNLNSLANATYLFQGAGLSCATYGQMLGSWAGNANLPNGISIGVQGLEYTDADVVNRDLVVNQNSITLLGDINVGATCTTAELSENNANQLSIFPNPGTEMIYISVNHPTTAVLMASNGAILTNLELKGDIGFDVSSYGPGVYFIRIQDGQTVKFIKE